MVIPRPGSGEYDPYYDTYVSKVTATDLLAALRTQQAGTASLLAGVTEAQAAFRYAPGKWTLREVIGHLADAERIFAYRLFRIARGDTTPLASFDENQYAGIAEYEGRPMVSVAAEFAVVRAATVALLESLPPEALARMGTASGKPVSARALAFIIAGHETHHLGVIRERYLK
jgi:uncharacterized damage-inducible protein DinB